MSSLNELSQSSVLRRIAAVVLPDLLCEIASPALQCSRSSRARSGTPTGKRSKTSSKPPLGVVLVTDDHAEPGAESLRATAVLAAADERARRYGVRPGQTLAEARALVAGLSVREVTERTVREHLGRIAETAMRFGAPVSFEPPDTVWVDITGAAHLMGGEAALAAELAACVRALGHVARVAVSDGPRLARAFARWESPNRLMDGCAVVTSQETVERLSALPVLALPLDEERASWLVRLGVLTVGDLARLPRAAASSRLGEHARIVLDLLEGRDDTVLVAYDPPAAPTEEITWDDPANSSEPLLFALRGLVARLSARLEGRGEAVQSLDLVVLHDRSIAQLRQAPLETRLRFDLAAPLWRSEELWRVLSARLGRAKLLAPTVGLRLEAAAITRALKLQLDLSRAGGPGSGALRPEALPVLLGELAGDIGKDRFGILELCDTHRLEGKSQLATVPAQPVNRKPGGLASNALEGAPTRLLPKPVPLEVALRVGASVSIDHRLYSIGRIEFDRRLDGVEWWTRRPLSRDYLRLWLDGPGTGIEALVYVDRVTGKRFLHALYD